MLLFGLIIVLLITISCNSGIQQTVDLSNSPIVAEVKLTATGDSVVVCNMDLVTDTIDFPMGLLLSNLELVKLDDGENASIKNVSLQAVSSNYIGLYSFYGGIKLFNREGHFISKISGKGQGPNDYSYGPSDMLIDESNDCLYFTEPGMEKLMVFDLKGNPKKPIPLFPFNNLEGHYNTHMSFCFDHEHNILKIAHIPFSSEEPAYWIQDEEGNLVQWVAGKHLASNRDFSNTLANMQNTSENDYSIGYWFDERVDSLYHYDEIKNRMKPVFTANLDCITKYHKYIELPDYYYIYMGDYGAVVNNNVYVLIDKHTLRGSYVHFKFDMLGNINTGQWLDFTRGNYIRCIQPALLIEQWQGSKDFSELPPNMSKFMKYLQSHDTEGMNYLVLIGELKQNSSEEFTLKDMNY